MAVKETIRLIAFSGRDVDASGMVELRSWIAAHVRLGHAVTIQISASGYADCIEPEPVSE